MNFHDAPKAANARDRSDIAGEIEIETLIECRVVGIRSRNQKQPVAVGARPHGGFSRNIAAGAGMVLDNELLSEALRQPLRNQPCGDVGAAARRKTDEQVDGASGVIEGLGEL